MSIYEKTGKRLGYALGIALIFLTPSTKTEADALPLPVLETVPIEVDIASLPASEQAAPVPILRAARQLDTI
jgi:hypothetical protein